MPQTVDIPGVGSIDFPDNMPPEVMHGEVSKLLSGGGQSSGVGINNLSSPIAAQQTPSLLSQLGNAFRPSVMMDTFNQGATGVLNSSTMLVNQFRAPQEQYAMPYNANQSVINPEVLNVMRSLLGGNYQQPGLTPQQQPPPQQGIIPQAADAIVQNLQGFTTPGNLALLPAASEAVTGQALAPVVKALFGAGLGQAAGEGGVQTVRDVRDPNKTKGDVSADVVNTLIPALMAGGMVLEGLKAPEAEGMSGEEKRQVANETTGQQYKALLNPPRERGQENTIPQQAQPIQLGDKVDLKQSLNQLEQQLKDVGTQEQQPAQQPLQQQQEQPQQQPTPLNPGGAQSSLPPDLQAQSKAANSPAAWGDFGGLNKDKEAKPKTPAPSASDVPTITPDYAASEKAAGRGGFVLETPRALTDKATSGFSPEARPDSQQLLGRLDNLGRAGKVSPSEVEYFKEQGLEEYLKTKPTVAEVGKWMQENGPKVEVTKYGEGGYSPEAKELAELQHSFIDNLKPEVREHAESYNENVLNRNEIAASHDLENLKEHFNNHDFKRLERWSDLRNKVDYQKEAVAHWSFVAPKAEKDMRGIVELAVVKPLQTKEEYFKKNPNAKEVEMSSQPEGARVKQSEQFPSSHNFPPNTLGFGRGYMETLPDGKKVFHVIEVQSDWAQAARDAQEYKKRFPNEEAPKDVGGRYSEPLLPHHENLVLKALISHAREQGADAIAVSDAETAMMSEGHDRAKTSDTNTPFTNKQQAEQAVIDLKQQGVDAEIKPSPTGTSWIVTQKGTIPQEKGMRLHYDQILPRALEKLTGKKGERVDFGEHDKAFYEHDTYAPGESGRAVKAGTMRKDLIFRNPDGTPKTSVTARLYPLDAIKERNDQPFTVFGKRYAASDVAEKAGDVAKASAPTTTPTSFADSRVTSNPQAKELGLRDGMTAHDVVQNIIKNPAYSDHSRALAGFLSENFEPALRSVPIEQGDVNQFDMNRGQGVINLAAHEEYGRGGLAGIALHEAAHAATEWASEFPRTATQRAAVERLNGLLDKGVKQLPTQIGDYLKNDFRPLYDRVRFGKASQLDLYRSLDENNISSGWFPRLYSMTTRGEMLAQMFGDREVFDWLNRDEDKGYVSKVWDGIKQLLGVKNGSIVDEALDTMRELGAERHADEWQPQTRLMDAVEGKLMPGAPGIPVGPERSTKEMIEANLAKLAGRSAPHTMQASAEVGNKLVRYASARIAAPQIGEAMASGVLKDKFRDAQFDKDLGRVMVQDRLNALRALHESKGDAELAAKVSNIMPENEFKTLLARKDIQAALERHKESVQTDLERMHRFLGGKMSVAGQETGAFVNLVALLNPDDVEAAKGFIYGSRKGDITNPLRKGSSFNQQAKGTAEAYEESYKAMVTRAYLGNYEEYAKQKLYEAYQKAGLGVEEKPGVKPPMFGGQPAAKVAVDRRGGKVSNLWVRRDLAPELRQALQTDSPVDKSGFAHLADLATELQVMGPTDFVFHMGNMLAALKWSQGSDSALMDVARKLPMVSIADTAGRLGKAMRDVYTSTPEIQREMAELAVIGAGRAEARHQGLVTEGLKKLGVSEETAQRADPNYYTSRLIKFMDKSGRLAANRMFDNLVERGIAVDDEANRREFINRMGQYNERLMTQTQQRARDMGLSPFVTAGRTFNRLAMQRLLQSPGYRAQNPVAAAKGRLVETIGTASVMFALPIAWNLAHTGSAFPKGIPNAGALALKKNDDGTWEYMDLLQGNLMRRGLRITGLQAMEKDMKLGDSVGRTTLDMGKAIVEGVLNPWEGPAVRAAKVGMTGKDFSGFLASRNPDNTGENVKAALMNLNPTVATLFGDETKGAKNTVSRLAQVGGLKSGTKGTFEEQADEQAMAQYKKPYASLSLREKAQVEKSMKAAQPQTNELAERASGERAYWSGIQRKDDLVAAIPQDVNKFISDNKLKLPGFDEVRTIDKERVPLTNSERKQFEAVVAQKYEAQVRRFMSNPDFVNRTQPSKQAAFDKGMALARRQAWAAFRRSGSQSSSQPAP